MEVSNVEPRLDELVTRLLAATRAATVEWDESDVEDEFIYVGLGGAVRCGSRDKDGVAPFQLKIFNDEGKQVERMVTFGSEGPDQKVIDQLPARPDAAAPRASGTLESHYAPHTPVGLKEADALGDALARLAAQGRRAALIHHSALDRLGGARPHAHLPLPATPEGYAHGLYAALRAMDEAGAHCILVETPPQTDAWLGVNDRLRRAAHGSGAIVDGLIYNTPPL